MDELYRGCGWDSERPRETWGGPQWGLQGPGGHGRTNLIKILPASKFTSGWAGGHDWVTLALNPNERLGEGKEQKTAQPEHLDMHPFLLHSRRYVFPSSQAISESRSGKWNNSEILNNYQGGSYLKGLEGVSAWLLKFPAKKLFLCGQISYVP